jgi:hypothetical protein
MPPNRESLWRQRPLGRHLQVHELRQATEWETVAGGDSAGEGPWFKRQNFASRALAAGRDRDAGTGRSDREDSHAPTPSVAARGSGVRVPASALGNAGAPPDDRRLPRPRPLLLRRGVGEVVEVRIRDCMAGARTTKVGDPGIGVHGSPRAGSSPVLPAPRRRSRSPSCPCGGRPAGRSRPRCRFRGPSRSGMT